MPDITLANFNMLFIRYFDTIEKQNHLPLGPLYLGRVLQDAGMDVDFRDYQLFESDDPFCTESILQFLHYPAKVVGISCMTNLLPFLVLTMKEFKRRYPDRIVVIGGVAPKSIEEKLLKQFEWIDVVSSGEGEKLIVPLVRALNGEGSLEKVPGIWYRGADGEIRSNPAPPRIESLDNTGWPAFDLVDLKKYVGYGMMTSRGCPYRCTFCSVAPIWGHKPAIRSNEDIINEMRFLHEEAGANLFLFQDEFFISSMPRANAFCKALIRSGLSVKFKAFGRVDLTDTDTMAALAEAGCIELRYGIESGSDKVLEKTKKGFTAEQALEVVSEAVNIIPRVDAFYVWGFPFETMKDFQESIMQMLTMRLSGVRVLPSMLALLPQTNIFKEYGPEKLEFAEDLFPEYMLTGHEVTSLAHVEVKPEHKAYFDFIKEYPDLFPGFFHYDLEENILPKLKILQEFGFYPSGDDHSEDIESCGAHSPTT